jgi:predicted transcriptional regulator
VANPVRDSGWTLLSNHGKVLVCIARDPEVRVSEIAEMVGIKERAVQRILAELRDEGIVSSTRDGRRNHYRVNRRRRMPWARDRALQVGQLIDATER